MKRHVQIISFILLCVYIAAVGFLCLMKPEQIPSVPFELWGIPIDKAVHFLMFLPFPVLVWFTFDNSKRKSLGTILFLLVIIVSGLVLAFGTEVLQKASGYRSFEMNDFYADAAGMTLCWLILCLSVCINRIYRKKKKCSKN